MAFVEKFPFPKDNVYDESQAARISTMFQRAAIHFGQNLAGSPNFSQTAADKELGVFRQVVVPDIVYHGVVIRSVPGFQKRRLRIIIEQGDEA